MEVAVSVPTLDRVCLSLSLCGPISINEAHTEMNPMGIDILRVLEAWLALKVTFSNK